MLFGLKEFQGAHPDRHDGMLTQNERTLVRELKHIEIGIELMKGRRIFMPGEDHRIASHMTNEINEAARRAERRIGA